MREVMVEVNVEPLPEGGYLATSQALQGLVAQGRTVAETLEIAQDVARKIIESCLEHGDPLPPGIATALSAKQKKAHTHIPVSVDTGV